MNKNDLMQLKNGEVFRILSIQGEQVLAINCQNKMMPKFFPASYFENAEIVESIPVNFPSIEKLSPAEQKIAHNRYAMISGPLAVVSEPKKRSMMIAGSSKQFGISKQSIRSFLCTYLIYQDIAALAPKQSQKKS